MTRSSTQRSFVFIVTFVVCCLSVLTGSIEAQEPTVLRVSLTEAQDRALATSHRLAEVRARAATAEAAVVVQEVADRPFVGFELGYLRTNRVLEFALPGADGRPRVVFPNVPNNYRTRWDLRWPIYDGGRTDALERAARAEASAASADVAAAQADLRLEVARAFWALVTARAATTVVEQSLTRAQANVADVRQQLAAGLVPPNELASAEAQESLQRMLLIETRNQSDQSSSELARLIGEEVVQPIEPSANLVLETSTTPSLQGLVSGALATRAERRAMEQRILAADDQTSAVEGTRRPSIESIGSFNYERPNPFIFPRTDRWDDSWSAGISARWALWDGGRADAEAARARTVAEAARQRLAEFDSIVALEVRQRLLDIDSGRAAVVASDDAVRAATEARRVVNERYRAGVAIQSDVLEADVVLLQAELDRTRAIAGVRLAEARLSRALGK